MKQGFYQRYGSEAFSRQLLENDIRFAQWTQSDSKKTKNFDPVPNLRP